MIKETKNLAVDNLPLTCLLGFFLLIGAARAFQDSTYKTEFPTTFEDQFSPEEQIQVRESLRWQLIAWQSDFNTSSRFTRVIVKRECFQSADGQWLSGLCTQNQEGNPVIIVYAGQSMEVPSFYHELCHLNVDSGNGHTDPRWPQWEIRNDELCDFLIRGRKTN